jgi:hypothetical protein
VKSVYAINTRTPTIKTHDEYDKYIAEKTVEKALAVHNRSYTADFGPPYPM